MISVTRFNDSTLIINADLIQTVEETPDTVITLTTGTKFIVKEKRNDMHIILNHSSMVPIYEQLMEQIKSEIINTALKEGEALPSVRSLAGELRISALTVKKAYDKLEEEGFVTTIHGKGTYVTASDKQLALEARQREAEADFEKAIDRALAMGMSREDILETVTLLLEEK
mgnify:FL=1